jgi:DNA-binding transcriptional ArsR family regulator
MLKKKICPFCFRLLSEKNRAKIIQYLQKKPKKAGEIQAKFSLTQPTISYHLKILEKAGMISSRKKGREVYYSLNKNYPCKKCSLFKVSL